MQICRWSWSSPRPEGSGRDSGSRYCEYQHSGCASRAHFASNDCLDENEHTLIKKYRFWTLQRRFERLNISIFRHQKAHWRHIVRFRIICKNFLDEVDFSDFQLTRSKPKILQSYIVFLQFKFSCSWKNTLLLIMYQTLIISRAHVFVDSSDFGSFQRKTKTRNT